MKENLVFFAVFAALLAWRNGLVAKNIFLTKAPLPPAYYSGGDHESKCRIIKDEPQLKYCEDATFWDLKEKDGSLQDRLLILSCDPNRKAWNSDGPLRDPTPRGALWVYDQKSDKVEYISFKGYPAGHDFHPLGLEIWPSYGGNASNLFVVNHGRHNTTIEQFYMSPSNPFQATWVRTVTSKYFVSPNSIALTSPTSFYVTNDHLMTRRLPSFLGEVLPMAEFLFGLSLGWVSHVSLTSTNPSSFSIQHSLSAIGIAFANGIALSHDGKTLAVASSSLAEVRFYSRNPSTNAISLTSRVPLPFATDNIMFDDDGTLLVAGHPHFPSLIAVVKNKTDAAAPSWVAAVKPRQLYLKHPETGAHLTLKIPSPEYDMQAPLSASKKVPPARSHEVETLYQSDGSHFPNSCTALRDGRTGMLYVTGLYTEGLLACEP
ncbi:calcium-dependent phosphotriesterase [Neolentinus lepideus HHB14362 ss-1]|uniref:Calcium-dependent phosphotriesterase n=1 Tax=Neolentinus lepideus HHB14362 ss-1 TaxID=1314782 RepID=A0A165QFC4_9AGAM|nr:calcium-dependent phosphotriesterase [Neolentinus lepideus HHB14362 ss-1]